MCLSVCMCCIPSCICSDCIPHTENPVALYLYPHMSSQIHKCLSWQEKMSDVSGFSVEVLGTGSRTHATVWPSFSPHITTVKMLKHVMHYTKKHKHLSAPLHIAADYAIIKECTLSTLQKHTCTVSPVQIIQYQIKKRLKLLIQIKSVGLGASI